ncbi:hypothetical protein [Methylomicrobium lacus]|uniref:hypothetical protein n=1 Tax=Methylomicrobium lacus TaxID=136992 RepID=UPI0035A8FEAC
MSRYNGNYDRDDTSIFWQVMLAILAAALILGTIAGIVTYLKNEAEERQMRIMMEELNRDLRNIGSSFRREIVGSDRESGNQGIRPYPLFSAPRIEMPKTREQIVQENSAKVHQDAIQGMSEFKKVYKKPEKCNYQNDHATRMFCANDFIRAKKEWDKENGIARN